jgi:AcrR family transcriptional regulator
MSDRADESGAPVGGRSVSTSSTADRAKRRQILDGARLVFLSRGFDGASMGEIAKAAGVSKGTLYVYFDSKETLFEALTVEEKECLAEAVFRLDADDADLRGALTRLGHSYLAMLGRPEHVSSIRMVIGTAEKFPRFGRMFYEAGPENGITRLKAYLDHQVAAGRLSIEDTRLAAQHFIDLCQSGLMRRLLFAVGDAPTSDEIAYQVDKAIWVFFKAYGPPDQSIFRPSESGSP